MKTWKIHTGMRFVKDFEIEAKTKEEAMEKLENSGLLDENFNINDWEFANDDYDVWEIESKIQIGDIVTVTDSGYTYSTYYQFFTEHNLSVDIASRFNIGRTPIVNDKYKVLYIGNHQLDNKCKIYVLENTGLMDVDNRIYLIGEGGIKKAEN